ncbi:MAG: FadR/GntR family transcriptional regulator [Qingshengfaniella sp.]
MARPKSTLSFEKLSTQRSFENVVEQIRNRIASGELRMGDRLPPERDLAQMLGVSRNTVREALRAMEHSGVLELKPGIAGGAFVRNGTASVLKTGLGDLFHLGVISGANLTEARIIITAEVARLACKRRTEADIGALEANFTEMKAAALAENYPLRASLNLKFHTILARAARNPVLVVLTDALVSATQEIVVAIGAMPNDFVISSRLRMIEYVRNRDGDAAAREAADYLHTVHERYLHAYDAPPAPPQA